MALDIYQAVTDRILELLDQGTVPWRKPFTGEEGQALPKNLISDKHYRGINVFLLAVTAMLEGYESPYWLTFKQAKQRDASVRKGEKGSLVIFWKQHATTDRDTGEPITVPVLRYYKLFNAQQCEGLALPESPEQPREPVSFEPIYQAMAIVEDYRDGPRIEHGGGRAFYSPSQDLVKLPTPQRFESPESYYATMFHELVHSTGHRSRLDRGIENPTPFGSADYSREELVAEMGAAFLCAASGISNTTIENSAAYIESWKKRLKGDKKLVVQAAGAGQKAVDWMLGTHSAAQQHETAQQVVHP